MYTMYAFVCHEKSLLKLITSTASLKNLFDGAFDVFHLISNDVLPSHSGVRRSLKTINIHYSLLF